MSQWNKFIALLREVHGAEYQVVLKEAFDGLIMADDLWQFLNTGAGTPEGQVL